MSVVHLSKFYKPYNGGLESVVADICEALAEENMTVIASHPSSLDVSVKINGVRVIRTKELVNIFSTSIDFKYCFNVVNSSDNSLYHIHLPNPLANFAWIFRTLFLKKNSGLVVHWHSDIVKQKWLLKIYTPVMNWLLKRADSIVVTSPIYLKESTQIRNYISKTRVIPIGINSIIDRVDNKKVNEIKNRYEGKKIVFSLGRHVYYKGFEYLIECAKETSSDSVFLIGGTGPDTNKYIELINYYGLQSKVFLVGRIENDDLPSYYAASEVFAFPSIERSEAFGVVQLEAMSVGTPIVCCNIKGSGVSWVNKHGVSGLVCEPKNSKDLARSLNKLLDDSDLRARLSYGATKRFENSFTREKMAIAFSALYKELKNK